MSGQFAIVDNLNTNELYGFTVVAVNEYGTSLPSSIVTINVTEQGKESISIIDSTGTDEWDKTALYLELPYHILL